MKAISELFALPLIIEQRCADANWGAAITEQGDDAWIAEINPRTSGHWNQTLLVSARDRAEAIARTVNEHDGMQATIANLLFALFQQCNADMPIAEFRASPAVKEAEKYVRDWAGEATK